MSHTCSGVQPKFFLSLYYIPISFVNALTFNFLLFEVNSGSVPSLRAVPFAFVGVICGARQLQSNVICILVVGSVSCFALTFLLRSCIGCRMRGVELISSLSQECFFMSCQCGLINELKKRVLYHSWV